MTYIPTKAEQELRKIFGAQLYKARDAAGLTQGQLAERIGVGPQTISNWERGYYFPDKVDTLLKLAGVLNCDPDYLLGRLDESTHDIHFVHEMTGLSEPAIKKISRPRLNNTFSEVLSRLILSERYDNLITSYNHYLLSLFSMRAKDTLQDECIDEYTDDGKVILSKYSSVMHYKQDVASVMNQICDDDFAEWMAIMPNPVVEMANDALSADDASDKERK